MNPARPGEDCGAEHARASGRANNTQATPESTAGLPPILTAQAAPQDPPWLVRQLPRLVPLGAPAELQTKPSSPPPATQHESTIETS